MKKRSFRETLAAAERPGYEVSTPVPFTLRDFQDPKDQGTIVSRYLTLEKLVSLLELEAMWFSCLTALQDRFEGTLPRLAFERLHRSNLQAKESFPREDLRPQFDGMAARSVADAIGDLVSTRYGGINGEAAQVGTANPSTPGRAYWRALPANKRQWTAPHPGYSSACLGSASNLQLAQGSTMTELWERNSSTDAICRPMFRGAVVSTANGEANGHDVIALPVSMTLSSGMIEF